MNALKEHIKISKFDAYKERISKLKPNIASNAQKVTDILEPGNQVPPEALITLGEYQIISQKWLSKQPPLDKFFEEGQKLNPLPNETDNTKRQCWLDGDVYRYNELGSQWMLEKFGARVPSYDEIIEIYKNAQGRNNAEKMKSMGVVATGWRDADVGRVEYLEFACLRSSSSYGNGNLLAVRLHPDRSVVGQFGFGSRTGIVPFGVRDKTVSA